AIRSDARLWPFADRPEFVEWAVNTAAGDSKDVSEVSAGEAMAALDAPRVKLVGKFLEVLKRHVNASAAYVRDPLQEVLNDDRAWTGHVGQFATAAVDDIHVARGLGVSVLDEARVRELEPYDALDAVKQ